MYRDTRLRNDSSQLQKLSALLAAADSAPANWQDYLRNGIVQLNADLGRFSSEDFLVKGLPATMEGAELIAFWKDTWAGFAAALSVWPEIRKAAAEIVEA